MSDPGDIATRTVITASAAATHPEGTVLDENGHPVTDEAGRPVTEEQE